MLPQPDVQLIGPVALHLLMDRTRRSISEHMTGAFLMAPFVATVSIVVGVGITVQCSPTGC